MPPLTFVNWLDLPVSNKFPVCSRAAAWAQHGLFSSAAAAADLPNGQLIFSGELSRAQASPSRETAEQACWRWHCSRSESDERRWPAHAHLRRAALLQCGAQRVQRVHLPRSRARHAGLLGGRCCCVWIDALSRTRVPARAPLPSVRRLLCARVRTMSALSVRYLIRSWTAVNADRWTLIAWHLCSP